MKIEWLIEQPDCDALNAFVTQHMSKTFVVERIRLNVEGPEPSFSRSRFWRALVMCLLTTRQRSGPDSAVTRFLNRDPFPLSLAVCEENSSAGYMTQVLRVAGGIRRADTIGTQLSQNLRTLEGGGWPLVEEIARRLVQQRSSNPMDAHKNGERSAAAAVDEGFEGIGPKQSRNLWQSLGLTRYEIPLDSRVAKWLKKAKFPLSVSPNLLADTDYYNFVLDGVQLLCAKSNVLPCIFDAAVFASYDPEWNVGQIVN